MNLTNSCDDDDHDANQPPSLADETQRKEMRSEYRLELYRQDCLLFDADLFSQERQVIS